MSDIKVKNLVLKKGRPKVVVPITAELPTDIIAQCEALGDLPCDMVEWRADYYLSTIEDIDGWLEDKNSYLDMVKILDDMEFIAGGKPIIFTIRSLEQGGRVQITKEQLESIYGLVIQTGLADFVDIELYDKTGALHRQWLQEQLAEIHSMGGRVILSHHDFEKTPHYKEMLRAIEEMHKLGADICKLSVMAKSEEDAKKLLKTAAYLDGKGVGPLVMLSMGEHGKATRVAGGKYGSVMTFASAGEASAPGQVDVHTMKEWLDDYYKQEGNTND